MGLSEKVHHAGIWNLCYGRSSVLLHCQKGCSPFPGAALHSALCYFGTLHSPFCMHHQPLTFHPSPLPPTSKIPDIFFSTMLQTRACKPLYGHFRYKIECLFPLSFLSKVHGFHHRDAKRQRGRFTSHLESSSHEWPVAPFNSTPEVPSGKAQSLPLLSLCPSKRPPYF